MSLADLSALAAQQYGLMSHAQVAKELSRTRLSRLVRAGSWQVVRPGVYRRFAKKQTEAQELKAVQLWDDTAVVSHSSAGRLLGLTLEREELEFTVPKFKGEHSRR